jgi:predicted nucleic acid-binding protein
VVEFPYAFSFCVNFQDSHNLKVAINHTEEGYASLFAAKHKMVMADALIYAVARSCEAELWTQDNHFENLPGIRFFEK